MLVGKNVVLEAIEPGGVEKMRVWRNDPELRRYFREYRDITKDMQEKWYKSKGNNSSPNNIYFQIMALPEDKSVENRFLVGCCGLLNIDWRVSSAELSIFMPGYKRTEENKEALSILFDYGFKELNLHKIWAEAYEFNEDIEMYINDMKMREDGRARHTCFVGGEYYDSVMLSVLGTEWG